MTGRHRASRHRWGTKAEPLMPASDLNDTNPTLALKRAKERATSWRRVRRALRVRPWHRRALTTAFDLLNPLTVGLIGMGLLVSAAALYGVTNLGLHGTPTADPSGPISPGAVVMSNATHDTSTQASIETASGNTDSLSDRVEETTQITSLVVSASPSAMPSTTPPAVLLPMPGPSYSHGGVETIPDTSTPSVMPTTDPSTPAEMSASSTGSPADAPPGTSGTDSFTIGISLGLVAPSPSG